MDTDLIPIRSNQLTMVAEENNGQAMVEYSLIVVLLVIVCIVIVSQIGDIVENGLYGAIEQLPL